MSDGKWKGVSYSVETIGMFERSPGCPRQLDVSDVDLQRIVH